MIHTNVAAIVRSQIRVFTPINGLQTVGDRLLLLPDDNAVAAHVLDFGKVSDRSRRFRVEGTLKKPVGLMQPLLAAQSLPAHVYGEKIDPAIAGLCGLAVVHAAPPNLPQRVDLRRPSSVGEERVGRQIHRFHQFCPLTRNFGLPLPSL